MSRDMSRASAESDTESTRSGDGLDKVFGHDAQDPRSLRKAFKHFKIPLVASLFGEMFFCDAMTDFAEGGAKTEASMPGHVEDAMGLAPAYWRVFAVFVLARIIIVFGWRAHAFRLKDSTFAASFMFFSTFQWAFYLMAYYRLSEEMTGLVWSSRIMVEAGAIGSQSEMFDCLNHHAPLECRAKVSESVSCIRLFDPNECAGYSLVGNETNQVKCCVRHTYSLAQPPVKVTFLNISMGNVFSILQWLAVLATKWVLERTPMLNGNSGAQFIQGATVDILDSVIFGAYILNKKVMYPLYGINASGDIGSAGVKDGSLFNLVFNTWAIAFCTALLSPVLYTLLRRVDTETTEQVRTFASALTDLMESLRMLRKEESHDLVDEALKLQLDQYVEESSGTEELHHVYVAELQMPLDSSDSDELGFDSMSPTDSLNLIKQKTHNAITLGNGGTGRPAMAKHSSGAMYEVDFLDKQKPKNSSVDISMLRPNVTVSPGPLAPGCISGWCSGRQSEHESFDSWAEVIDSARSLFLLELPFLCWRMYFELENLTLDSFCVIVMAKNVVWGIHDLLVIVSCNNPSAKIFGFTPLATLSHMIGGSAMGSVFVGPAGFFRIAADFAAERVKQNLEQQINDANLHKAWLIVEREKIIHATPGDLKAIAHYDTAIHAATMMLEDLKTQEQMIHT